MHPLFHNHLPSYDRSGQEWIFVFWRILIFREECGWGNSSIDLVTVSSGWKVAFESVLRI